MKIRNLLVAIVGLTVVGFVSDDLMAQNSGASNLFSQYYTQGGSWNNAAMYPAPMPVPSHVGGTYYTYQPLMPHEMMYTHGRTYYNYYAGPESFYCNQCGGPPRGGYGVTKTTVRWQNGCAHIAPFPGISAPYTRATNFVNRFKSVKPPRRGGLSSCGGCSDGSCGGSFDGGSSCESCNSGYATNWQQARQNAVARAADGYANPSLR